MTKEELSRQYADQKVKDSPNNEYKNYPLSKQKELTRFDGYDIEQAYEDGYDAAIIRQRNNVWHKISLDDKPNPGSHCLIYMVEEGRKRIDQGKWNAEKMRWDYTTFNNIPFGYADKWCYLNDILSEED